MAYNPLLPSIINRFLILLALSFLYSVLGIVIVENSEINKLFPPSPAKFIALALGYIAAIFSTNYILALRGNNFTTYKIELLAMFICVILFLGFYCPFSFQNITVTSKWYFLSTETKQPNYYYFYLLVLACPAAILFYKELASFVYKHNLLDADLVPDFKNEEVIEIKKISNSKRPS
jgi:hypothetical protein